MQAAIIRRIPALLRSLPAASAAAGGGLAVERCSTAALAAARRRHWQAAAPISVRLGAATAGAVSFSVSMATAAVEAKERVPAELVPNDVVLYQYEACPFCNKVKAFLDFHNIPYKVVEVNPLSKKEIKWSDYKKVPILVVDGEQLVDSSDIIDKLNNQIHPDNSVVDEEEKKWRRWVDEHLVHVLSPNIYRTTSEALESFDYISSEGNFSRYEKFTVKYAGAAIMYMVSKKLKKKHNITDERASLYEAAETWTKGLEGKDFLGGSKPNLADLAVYGVLRPIRHLKAGKDMVENTHIGEWYQRMETAVGESELVEQREARLIYRYQRMETAVEESELLEQREARLIYRQSMLDKREDYLDLKLSKLNQREIDLNSREAQLIEWEKALIKFYRDFLRKKTPP